MNVGSVVGAAAAILTSLSYLPQVRKAWPRASTDDLSLKMLGALTLGLMLWVVYGFMRGDWVVVVANTVGASLSGIVFGCKVRDLVSGGPKTEQPYRAEVEAEGQPGCPHHREKKP